MNLGIRARVGERRGERLERTRTLVMPLKRKENTRITAETVERMSCPQKPHRPRVLHACEVLATFLEIPAVESSSLAIALAAAAFLPRTATPGVFEESLSASEPSPLIAARRARRVADDPEGRDAHAATGMAARDATGARGVASGARSETAAVTALNAMVSRERDGGRAGTKSMRYPSAGAPSSAVTVGTEANWQPGDRPGDATVTGRI